MHYVVQNKEFPSRYSGSSTLKTLNATLDNLFLNIQAQEDL